GVVSTGGPNLTVTWSYSQAQGKPQTEYRVQVTDSTGTVVHYDSGWLAGAATSHTFDAVAAGVPTDTTGSQLRALVLVQAQNVNDQGISPAQAFDIQWGVVTPTITSPTGTVTTQTVTVNWTFSSTRGKTQSAYRAVLTYAEGGATLEDSGKVTSSTATSHAFTYPLANGSSYKVTLTLYNSEGVAGTDTVTFPVSLPSGTTYPDEPDVGVIYEVGVAGRGFMLFDNRTEDTMRQFRYQRRTVPLQAQRFATGDTPFGQAVERYVFSSMSDFRGGRGQLLADRETSDPSTFLESQGVWPFEPQQLTLLNSVAREQSVTYGASDMATAGNNLYWLSAANQISYLTGPGGTPSSFTVAAAGTLDGFVSDGDRWYAGDATNGIFRGTTSDPGAVWSTIKATTLAWAAGRLCAAYPGTGSTTRNVFTTLNDSGAEEVANGRITLRPGWDIVSIEGGSGWVWFAAVNGDKGEIYAWKAGAVDSPFLALQLPPGTVPVRLTWAGGRMIMLAVDRVSGGEMELWTLAPDVTSGTLVPFLVDELGTFDVAGCAVKGNTVWFGWTAMDGTNAGVGAYDLRSGGYCKGYQSTVAGDVPSVVMWNGRVGFLVAGDGIWLQDPSSYVTSGWVRTPVADGGSIMPKIFDTITIEGKNLTSGQSFDVDYSLDYGGSYTNLGTFSDIGQRAKTFTLDQQGSALSVQVTLNGPGTSTPSLSVVSSKYHLLGAADTILVLPIDCSDHVKGLNGAPLDDNGPGAGAARARWLESLIQTVVPVQDIDWAETRTTENYELIAVDISKWSIYDRRAGRQNVRAVAECTFRKVAR
ncbi:MAG: hypothetical protein D6746_04600, partial [Bacteroidetes bacterium]